MGIRYYKKLTPATAVVLANGTRCKFDTFDHVWGYFATDKDYAQSEFARLMEEQRFAISEISAEEFTTEYIVKKKAGMQPPKLSREEFGSGTVRQAVKGFDNGAAASLASAAAGVDKPDLGPRPMPAAATMVEPAAQAEILKNLTPAAKPVVTEFKPVTGKRNKANVPNPRPT